MNTLSVSKKTLTASLGLAILVALATAVLSGLLGRSPARPLASQINSSADQQAQALVSSKQDSSAALATGPTFVSSATLDSLTAFRDNFLSQPLTIDPALVQRALAGGLDGLNGLKGGPLSDYQRSIISDGVITLDEYKQAESQYRGCLVASGYSVAPLVLTTLGRYLPAEGIQLGADVQKGEADEASCQSQYTGVVDFIWSNVTAPIQEKVAQAQGAAMAQCLAQVTDSREYAAAKGACTEAVIKATNTWVYLGGS